MNEIQKKYRLRLFIWLGASLFCFIFSRIYYQFSHGIHSNYMTFLFLCPLIGGAVYCAVNMIFGKIDINIGTSIYQSGVITLTVGCLSCGCIDIYGTTSHLLKWFFIVGGILCILGLTVTILSHSKISSNRR